MHDRTMKTSRSDGIAVTKIDAEKSGAEIIDVLLLGSFPTSAIMNVEARGGIAS